MRRIVVITGMARSGTSLLAHICQSLGLYLGTNLCPADEHNRDGYFENEVIHSHTEDLLRACAAEAVPHSVLEGYKAEMTAAVETELALAGDRLWGYKDAGSFLPIMNGVYRELDLDPVFFLAIRNPDNVVASLNAHPKVWFTPSRKRWDAYYGYVLKCIGDRATTVVDYDRWFYSESGSAQARAIARAMQLPMTDAWSSVPRAAFRHWQPKTAGTELYSELLERTGCSIHLDQPNPQSDAGCVFCSDEADAAEETRS